MKFKPQTKEELYSVIKEIVTNQLSDKSYRYGLKDVDTSLITDMINLFSCNDDDINYEINRKIDWDNPRNSIINWNVSNVQFCVDNKIISTQTVNKQIKNLFISFIH